MKCCVSFCKNSSASFSKLQNVAFHTFPTMQPLRSSWLAALRIEENQLADAAVVCSQHFQNDDFCLTVSGLRELRSDATPSLLQVCRICLDTTSKMFLLKKYNLEEAYKNVTGLTLREELNLAPMLCTECAQRLINCNSFRDKSLRAHTLLSKLVKNDNLLTMQNIMTINRLNNQLTSTIVKKTFEPNYCDVFIIENEEKCKNIETDRTVLSNSAENSIKIECILAEMSEVKTEESDNLILIIEPKVENVKYDNESDEEFIIDDMHNNLDCLSKDGVKKDKFVDNGSDTDVQIVNSDDYVSNNSEVLVKSDSDLEFLSKTAVKKAKTRNLHKKTRLKSKKSNKGIKLFKVSALTYEEQIADLHKRQETKNYRMSPFKCEICYKGYNGSNAFNGHMVKHTNAFGQFECGICGIHSISRNALRIHIVCNHSSRYSCTLCSFVTMYKNSAALHERWHKGTKYKCTQCDEQFSKSTSYKNHLRIKHPSEFACTHCGYSYVSQKGLQQHVRMKHRFDDVLSPEGPMCEACNIRFASEVAYNLHMKVSPKHSSVGELKRNEPSGVVKPKLKSDSASECEPITCEQCGIQLRDFRMYTNHFRRIHPDKNRTKFPGWNSAAMCELCGRVFQSEALYRWHMPCPISAAQKQYKCDVCDKTFRLKMQLTTHKRIHSDARPMHECPICGKAFATKGNRWRHLLIHSGIKFTCEICEKSFASEPERRSHVAHVHLKVPWPKRKRGHKTQPRHAKDEPVEQD